ncbi:MAG: hypothetical protein EVJ47_06260 [Candidatus Acidulodesulfobacterium ferriphilum]|uniref:Uncharacterized protein n=1 Tax=Candidatus Acidulodesulfobacterium ferriphilum TaxID=2597223 RepID=A0A519BAF9_9DELT|nr:MAG: hypothetical protein EVJ47_06260 [Candidatus Acidulodesulfobacterium ferriphilum]
MGIDKKIIEDIKNIGFKMEKILFHIWGNKSRLFKWALIILGLFIVYRVYKIITRHKVTRSLPVVNKTISIKKTGYYKLGVYLNINKKYFSERNIIANIVFNNGKNKNTENILLLKSLGSDLYYYYGNVNINGIKKHKFNKLIYKHLRFASAISNFKNGDSPFFLFYINFAPNNKLERILYTPINIPAANIFYSHIITAKIRNNGYIKLISSPADKKPEIKINKSIYFYPNYTIMGTVNNIKAVFEYKYKGKKFFKSIGIYSGELINIYKMLKNKKNKGNDIKLIKVNFTYKKIKNKKGSIKFTGSELIEPDISSFERIFMNFIFKKYFIDFMQHSAAFKKELKKQIIKDRKELIPPKTVKKNFINNTVKKIFLIDYNTKIAHISYIHNKIVRAFYRFIYRHYVHKRNLADYITTLFHHKKIWYKNILIPIKSDSIKLKVISEPNTARNKKTAYFLINFKNIKLYKYFTNDKAILNRIIYKEKEAKNKDKFILRGSNDDYWYGKQYYRNYPELHKIKLFIFNKKPEDIKSYFYFNGLPKPYPKILILKSNNDYPLFDISIISMPYNYNNTLSIIKKYNKIGPYNFFNKSLVLSENYKIVNIKEKEKEKEKDYVLLDKNYYSRISSQNNLNKIIILKIKSLNIRNFRDVLVKFYSNKKLKDIRKFIKLKAIILDNWDIKRQIVLPVKVISLNGSKYAKIYLTGSNLKYKLFDINEINLKAMPKRISRFNLYEFKQIHFKIVGNSITFFNFKKSNETLLKYIIKTPLISLKNEKTKFLSLRKFIKNEQQFNDLFKNGGGWIYKKIYLKKGIYYIGSLKNNLFQIEMFTLERSNAE